MVGCGEPRDLHGMMTSLPTTASIWRGWSKMLGGSAAVCKHTTRRQQMLAAVFISLYQQYRRVSPQGQHCSKIMKPPQSLPLQMAERLLELS